LFERLLHFVEGEVRFIAKDGFTAAFMTACKNEETVLRNVSVTEEGIAASVCWRDYKRVIRAAQNSGMLLVVSEQTGIPIILNKYRKRVGIPVGALLFSVILLFLSSMLWSIEITGLETINENSFREYLEQINVKQGVSLGNINCNEIEAFAEGYGESILRTTVNLVGCKLYVNVEEREVIREKDGYIRYGDIIAAKDGEILKADVFSGDSNVRVGDAVLKGDLLVSGAQNTPGGKTMFVEAKAMILARTQTSITCQTGKNIKVHRIGAAKNRYAIRMFGVTFPNPKNRIASTSYMSAETGVFPFALVRIRNKELYEDRVSLNDQKSFLIALTDLAAASVDLLKNVEVCDCRICVQKASQVSVEAQFVCKEDIAKQVLYETQD
jgi:similar to stage IV sporulation protein